MERAFPELLKQLHCIEIDYADEDGIEFDPLIPSSLKMIHLNG